MRPKDKVLTFEQARELKWFARNVAGTRLEFYECLDAIELYKKRIDRLQETAEMILDWCEKQDIKMYGEASEKEIRNQTKCEVEK